MQIRSVRCFLLSYVFPEPVEWDYYGGRRKVVKRDAMLIRVETDNGLVGYGPGEGSEAAEKIIREVIAPWLEGRVLRDADALRVRVLEAQLAKAVEQRNAQLDAKHDALNALADARIARVMPRQLPFPRPVFEFDPNVPGDFQRAKALAIANNGAIVRAQGR